jgi:hypothetical protein
MKSSRKLDGEENKLSALNPLMHGSQNHIPFSPPVLASWFVQPPPLVPQVPYGGRRWLLRGEHLVVVRTSEVCYGEGMDEVTQLMLFATDNPSLEEAFSVFCDVYMPARDFAETIRRGYRYDLAEWLSQVAVSHVKALNVDG